MLEELKVFAIVVEQSSMNKASAILNLSQPALAKLLSWSRISAHCFSAASARGWS